eukprot:2839964-Amphidinium_carterae.2
MDQSVQSGLRLAGSWQAAHCSLLLRGSWQVAHSTECPGSWIQSNLMSLLDSLKRSLVYALMRSVTVSLTAFQTSRSDSSKHSSAHCLSARPDQETGEYVTIFMIHPFHHGHIGHQDRSRKPRAAIHFQECFAGRPSQGQPSSFWPIKGYI